MSQSVILFVPFTMVTPPSRMLSGLIQSHPHYRNRRAKTDDLFILFI
jgi:hypothetical protein